MKGLILSKNIIIGASGLIGGALYRSFQDRGEKVVGTFTNNKSTNCDIYLDLNNPDFSVIKNLIKQEDNIYLLSAYSNPSWIFQNKEKARQLNLIGTKCFIDAVRPVNPRIIFMSSVEVFDGEKGAYAESDLPNPINYYGHLKFEIERYLLQTYPRHTIVRTGWNIGQTIQSRCVVKLTYESLLQNEAKMATDNYFSVSSVDDTAKTLRQLSACIDVPKIHICSDGVVNRADLARYVIENSKIGKKMHFTKCKFSDITYSEPRGRLNDLDNSYSKQMLGVNYMFAWESIIEKIRIIDECYLRSFHQQ